VLPPWLPNGVLLLRADRAYLRRRRIRAAIPEKAGQAATRKKKGRRGGRLVAHGTAFYRDRNTVERCIDKIKEWCGLATRYDETPVGYLAGQHLRGAVIRLRSLTRSPQLAAVPGRLRASERGRRRAQQGDDLFA